MLWNRVHYESTAIVEGTKRKQVVESENHRCLWTIIIGAIRVTSFYFCSFIYADVTKFDLAFRADGLDGLVGATQDSVHSAALYEFSWGMEKGSTKQWPQYLAAITATISLAITGSHIGWTSPSLPLLKREDSHIPLTSSEASWIASFYLLGSIPGNVLAAFVVDRFGRKSSLLIAGIPLFYGWVLIIVAWNPYILYAARFISGLGQGIVYVVCPMYIGEIADKNIRGSLGTFIKLMVTFGELYAHAIGPFVPYEWLAYCCAVIPILFFATFAWMPESPYYLLMKNDRAAAGKSLRRLRRYTDPEDVKSDLEQMANSVYRDLAERGHFWDLFDTPGNRRAVLISFGLQLILQFSGIAAIESYTQEIIEESDSGLSAGIAVIILSVLQLAAGLGAAVLVDRIGRRPLLLSTTLLAGLALTASAVFYLMKLHFRYPMEGLGWILDASVMFYELIIALGLSPLPYMMLGELFPTNVKGLAVSLANIWASLLAFVVSKMHQIVTDTCGIYAAFGWFASTCFFGIVFVYFVVPETNGKSLVEIQDELNSGRKIRKDGNTGRVEETFKERYVSSIC